MKLGRFWLRTKGSLTRGMVGSGADPFVIALAKARKASVLTDERPSNSLERPKIPDVCKVLGIECCRLSDVFERAGLTFN